MSSKPSFIIGQKAVLTLAIVNTILILIGSLNKVQHWPLANELLSVGLLLFIITWVLITRDMFLEHIKYKTLWIIGMFISPSFVSILYVFIRDSQLIEKSNV